MSVFAVSCAIENAPPAHSTATSFNRVGSPSAAKMLASALLERMMNGRPVTGLAPFIPPPLRRADITRDAVQLCLPAVRVHTEGFQPAMWRHLVEAGLDHGQQRAVAGCVAQREGHE